MKKATILKYLSEAKEHYRHEGLLIKGLFGSYARDEADETSDIDVLIEATPAFAKRYGFGAFGRLEAIRQEMSRALGGLPIDFADSSGMGHTAHMYIVDRTIYV
jgi:predicted nucleotidyltransferase